MLVFEHEEDVRRVMAVLPKRLARFGLTLHPEKTRLLDFRHPWRKLPVPADPPASPEPRSFDFLGFPHFWRRTRNGGYAVQQRTAGKRLSRAVAAVHQWCRDHRHRPLKEQHQALLAKLRGHYGYYYRIGNRSRLLEFRFQLLASWHQWLGRRSQKDRQSWRRFQASIVARFPLPYPPQQSATASANP